VDEKTINNALQELAAKRYIFRFHLWPNKRQVGYAINLDLVLRGVKSFLDVNIHVEDAVRRVPREEPEVVDVHKTRDFPKFKEAYDEIMSDKWKAPRDILLDYLNALNGRHIKTPNVWETVTQEISGMINLMIDVRDYPEKVKLKK